jgi:hypothetical protein
VHSGATFHTPKSFDANVTRNVAADLVCHDTNGDIFMDYRETRLTRRTVRIPGHEECAGNLACTRLTSTLISAMF